MTASTVYGDKVTIFKESGTHALQKPIVRGGVVKVASDTKTVATTSIDEVGDKIIMTQLPANAIPLSIKVFATDMDASASATIAFDVGLVKANEADTVVDVDCIATAVSIGGAATSAVTNGGIIGLELLSEASMTPADRVKTLWELGGVSAQPTDVTDYRVSLTVTTAAGTAASGTISMIVTYVEL